MSKQRTAQSLGSAQFTLTAFPRVFVRTSDIKGAGTVRRPSILRSAYNRLAAALTCVFLTRCTFSSQDANVFLSLKGTLRTEEEIELEKCLNHADKFERGHEDIFEFRLPPLGDLLSAKIMHDNSGLTNPDVRCLSPPHFVPAVCLYFSFRSLVSVTLPQWHLKEVEVVDTQNGVSFLFSCGKWLSREAAERKELDGNGSCLTDIEGVHLERVGASESDVRVWLLMEQPVVSLTPVLYRL